MREKLADLCHKQRSSWLQYMFSKGIFNEDGSWTMPEKFVRHWARQMHTDYKNLSESEQDSDRKEADKFLAVINKSK